MFVVKIGKHSYLTNYLFTIFASKTGVIFGYDLDKLKKTFKARSCVSFVLSMGLVVPVGTLVLDAGHHQGLPGSPKMFGLDAAMFGFDTAMKVFIVWLAWGIVRLSTPVPVILKIADHVVCERAGALYRNENSSYFGALTVLISWAGLSRVHDHVREGLILAFVSIILLIISFFVFDFARTPPDFGPLNARLARRGKADTAPTGRR